MHRTYSKKLLTGFGALLGGAMAGILVWMVFAPEPSEDASLVATIARSDETVPPECQPETALGEGEYIVGRPGVYLKVRVDGAMAQATGEELSRVEKVFGMNEDDEAIELKMECGSNAETGEASWFTSSFPMEKFFSTRPGVRMRLEISTQEQQSFRATQAPCKEPCEHPKLIAISDLNENGKKEFWFLEPDTHDMHVGIIEEPNQKLLSVCPGCPD
jgi:hypothetical protein